MIKIIDFGFSTTCKPDKKIQFMCGTPHYMSPELAMRKDHYGQPADVWALGVLLFIMLTGKLPFNGDFEDDLYRRISQCKIKITDEYQSLSNKVKSLFKKIFTADQTKRITTE